VAWRNSITFQSGVLALQINEVSREQVLQRLENGDATFVDICDPHSYLTAHVPGALNIGNHNIQEFIANQDPSQRVIVYCYHGISSRSAAAHLQESGFQDVASMTGGFAAWGDAPCEHGEKPDLTPAPSPARNSAATPSEGTPEADETAPPSRRRDLFRRVRSLLKP